MLPQVLEGDPAVGYVNSQQRWGWTAMQIDHPDRRSSMMDLVIKNGTLILPEGLRQADVGI